MEDKIVTNPSFYERWRALFETTAMLAASIAFAGKLRHVGWINSAMTTQELILATGINGFAVALSNEVIKTDSRFYRTMITLTALAGGALATPYIAQSVLKETATILTKEIALKIAAFNLLAKTAIYASSQIGSAAVCYFFPSEEGALSIENPVIISTPPKESPPQKTLSENSEASKAESKEEELPHFEEPKSATVITKLFWAAMAFSVAMASVYTYTSLNQMRNDGSCPQEPEEKFPAAPQLSCPWNASAPSNASLSLPLSMHFLSEAGAPWQERNPLSTALIASHFFKRDLIPLPDQTALMSPAKDLVKTAGKDANAQIEEERSPLSTALIASHFFKRDLIPPPTQTALMSPAKDLVNTAGKGANAQIEEEKSPLSTALIASHFFKHNLFGSFHHIQEEQPLKDKLTSYYNESMARSHIVEEAAAPSPVLGKGLSALSEARPLSFNQTDALPNVSMSPSLPSALPLHVSDDNAEGYFQKLIAGLSTGVVALAAVCTRVFRKQEMPKLSDEAHINHSVDLANRVRINGPELDLSGVREVNLETLEKWLQGLEVGPGFSLNLSNCPNLLWSDSEKIDEKEKKSRLNKLKNILKSLVEKKASQIDIQGSFTFTQERQNFLKSFEKYLYLECKERQTPIQVLVTVIKKVGGKQESLILPRSNMRAAKKKKG